MEEPVTREGVRRWSRRRRAVERVRRVREVVFARREAKEGGREAVEGVAGGVGVEVEVGRWGGGLVARGGRGLWKVGRRRRGLGGMVVVGCGGVALDDAMVNSLVRELGPYGG